ncbi:MAG: N-acetylneuraminate synthase family protein [Tepidisphaeraceae bacterium]
MTGEMDIAGRAIGAGRPTYVIAEIGVNHDGSLRRAIELVHAAAEAGADAVKLQLFTAANLVHETATAASYQSVNCGATDQASLLRKYELSCDDVERIIDAARVAGLQAIATPFSRQDVFVIEHLHVPAIKIASPDLVNQPLLQRCAETGRPMIVSTGAANADEIVRCVRWLKAWQVQFALMHCVSSYPTPNDLAHLGWIDRLRRDFPGIVVGYSDHTTEPLAGALAVAAGATVVEKHLTWNRFADGPDHAASADPAQFAAYVRAIRLADELRGDNGARRVLEVERDVRKLSRQSIVARREIAAGESVAEDDLTVQRPGTGVPASDWTKVVGRITRAAIPAGTILTWEMLRADAEHSAA